eukprot:symbB.v1.2.009116.t1/scaffold572.1/size185581/5
MFDFDDLEEQEETTTAPPELVAEEGLDGDGYLAGCRRETSLKEPSISPPNVEDVRTVEDVGTVEEAAISSPPKEDLAAATEVAVSSPPKEDPPVPAATEVVAEPEATLSLPREDPPAVPEVEVLPQAYEMVVAAVVTEEAPQTPPAQLRRPPGLMSPPKDSTCEVFGPQLRLSPQSRGHLLRPEELRQARGAARSVPETFLMAFNAQFYCYLDASGQALDVVATSGQSRVVVSSKICSCALKPDDRHLLMVCEDGNFFTYRLDRGSASTVLQLHFLEDPPKLLKLSNRFTETLLGFPKNKMMIHYSSLLSLLLLWTSEAQKSGCDLKDAECLDEKQVFFQLRSEVSDSKDSERSVAAQRRWRWRRWRRRNRRSHPYHPYGPNTTTTTTTTIPVCGEESIGVANFTSVDLPPGENVTVLLEVNQEVVKGCCVEDFQNTIDLDVSYSNPAGSLGNFTVFLETPDMQSKEVGVAFASQSPFGFDGNLFPGAVAGGTWTLTLLASPDAVGWSSFFSQIGIQLEQCV